MYIRRNNPPLVQMSAQAKEWYKAKMVKKNHEFNEFKISLKFLLSRKLSKQNIFAEFANPSEDFDCYLFFFSLNSLLC